MESNDPIYFRSSFKLLPTNQLEYCLILLFSSIHSNRSSRPPHRFLKQFIATAITEIKPGLEDDMIRISTEMILID